jgi:hypothetical protein
MVRLYLLSHKVGSVSGLHLEGTVFRPQIDRVGDAGAAPLVDLVQCQLGSLGRRER